MAYGNWNAPVKPVEKGLNDGVKRMSGDMADRIIFLDKALIRSQQQLAALTARLESLEKMFYPAHGIKVSEVEIHRGEVSAVHVCSMCGAVIPLKNITT